MGKWRVWVLEQMAPTQLSTEGAWMVIMTMVERVMERTVKIVADLEGGL
jgi:hypothetical protein